MRLCRTDDDGAISSPVQAIDSLEVLVREPSTDRILAQVLLRLRPGPSKLGNMQPAVAKSGVPQVGNLAHVAGSITAAPGQLEETVERWLADLAARKKSPKTILAYRQMTARFRRETGAGADADLTHQLVTEWMAGKGWMGVTYNRNLSLFRSLSSFMLNSGRIERNQLANAPRAEEDGSLGSRAATTEEVRAIIEHAWARELADRRCRGRAPAYFAMMAYAGCRLDEPSRMLRRNVNLAHPVPHVHWTRDIQKNKREAWIALHPDLVEILRRHLAQVDADLAAANCAAAGPDDPLFPSSPNKATFLKYRDDAGIPARDWRGVPLTSHGLRKWMRTTLGTMPDVSESMVNFLARHVAPGSRMAQHYQDPTLEQQLEALKKLSTIWPKPLHGGGLDCGQKKNSGMALAKPPDIRYNLPAESTSTKVSSVPREGPSRPSYLVDFATQPEAGEGPSSGTSSAVGQRPKRPRDRGPAHFASLNADLGTRNLGACNEIADVLEALARLLRKGSGDGTSSGSSVAG